MRILIYIQQRDIAKSVHTYIYIQAMSIKCIYLSAAAGRRYEQKVHILYIPIYLYGKVYTIYIHIEITNTVEILHPESRIHKKIFAGRISDRAQRALGASGNIYIHMAGRTRTWRKF